jgi:hypothetical protein
MKLIATSLLLFVVAMDSLQAQNEIIISRVFSSEKQNAMASKIPGILLDAYSKGEIMAYYPKNRNIPVNYVQMLHHFGASQEAEEMLNASPWWYCESSASAKVNAEMEQCFSQYFEIGELKQINRITRMPELKHLFIRLIYANDCSADGFEREGPVFKIKDVAKLEKEVYRLVNPRNPVYKYKIIDYLRLKSYSAR